MHGGCRRRMSVTCPFVRCRVRSGERSSGSTRPPPRAPDRCAFVINDRSHGRRSSRRSFPTAGEVARDGVLARDVSWGEPVAGGSRRAPSPHPRNMSFTNLHTGVQLFVMWLSRCPVDAGADSRPNCLVAPGPRDGGSACRPAPGAHADRPRTTSRVDRGGGDGASAGGVEALTSIAAQLPGELPLRRARRPARLRIGSSVLPAILDRAGPCRRASPATSEPISPGHTATSRRPRIT